MGSAEGTLIVLGQMGKRLGWLGDPMGGRRRVGPGMRASGSRARRMMRIEGRRGRVFS